jgi:N-acetylneuraminic acid mutarotase
MPSDKTRTSDDIRQGYKGPVMQQGRVILDRDFNALQETLSAAIEADALDIIGPCGTPDDGFAISIPGISSPPDPGLWVPPKPLVAPALPLQPFDFLISPGTMYVGGQRAVFPAADPGQQLFTYSYFDQPDWILPDDPSGGSPPASPQVEFIYLHLFEQEVSAVEDSDLKDVALGGPDTTQRLRLMRRVRRLPIVAGDCTSALDQAQGVWLKGGLQFAPPTMQLLPQAALQVSFTQSATASDPCDPVATGGYLGADNQLIRVQISDAEDGTAGSGKLLWGYDNASFLYRITINPDGKTLQLNQSPVDAFHAPQAGQVVEVLRTAAVLESDPDASDPFHQQTIVRCIAEASGEVRTLANGYDPGVGTVVLDQVLPAEYLDDATPVFLRIWQAELGFDPAGGTVELADAGGVTTGVQVTITIPTNGTPPVGAYWMIAVRPSTPQAVYPERFLLSPQPPDGPRQWACPLAVIDWTGAASSPPGEPFVEDCREDFDNLVELTKRKLGGCCTVGVIPADAQQPGGLQAIVDRAVTGGVPATICFTPGVYSLQEPLRFDARHSHLKLEGCQEGVILQAAPGAESKFLDGLVVLSQSDNVTVQGLAFNLPAVPFLAAGGKLAGLNPKLLLEIRGPSLTGLSVSIGIRPLKCNGLTVRRCKFTYPSFASGSPEAGSVNGFAVGILSGGGCVGLAIEENDFEGGPQLTAPFSEEPFQFLVGYALSPVSTIFGAKMQRRKITFEDVSSAYGLAVRGAIDSGLSVLIAKPALAATKRKSTAKRGKAKAASTSAAARTIDLSAFFGFTLNGNGTFLPAWLQEASFRANKFSDLTLGILIIGETGSLRIQDNEVVDSYAGAWLFPRRSPLPAPSSKSQSELEEIVQDPVIVIGSAIARGYPLPDQFSDPSQVNVALNLPLVLRRPLARSLLPGPLDAYNILSGTIEPSLESEAAQATSPSTAQGFNFSLQCASNSIDGQVAGTGRGSSNEVDIYDPETDSWTVGTPFVTPRRNFATDTDGAGSIWLAGGYAPSEPTASMEIFVNNTWSAGPEMPSVGVGLVGVYFPANGKFYVMGGRSSDTGGSEFTHPFEYDPASNSWTIKSATYPDNQVNNMACGVLTDQKIPYIYCVGGSAGGNTTATDRVFRYNPVNDVIESIAAPWPGNSDGITLPGGFAVLNNELYILGGFRINTGMINTVWKFTPTSNVWEPIAVLPVPLGFIPTAAIGTSIYTAGGSTWDGTTIQDSTNSFRYDPTANSFSAIAPIPRATSETRALNFQGKMYVMGGGKVAPISPNDGQGLIVWGDENGTATEVLLTGNRIRNSGTTTAVVKAVSLCAVTGNVILNNSQASGRESLFVSLLGNSNMMAITGNVFQGAPIIPSTWLQFNSISQ